MNKTLIVLILLLSYITAGAQTERRIYTNSERKALQARTAEQQLTKEQKKQLEALQDSLLHTNAIRALETLDFVLEADQLVFKRGETVYVTPTTNFVSLSDDKAVVQVSPFQNGDSPNGVGGITLEGRASNIRIKTDRKGNTKFDMNVIGSGLSATVTIQLYADGNRASILVNPYFHSRKVTLYGRLLPTEEATIFQGRTF